ncbi:hypothetical protein D9613_002450 [Agrocybe pediades]|uniref:Uncharacterized protein n=1 Tax=Agrocybe pediades TaxID=84607 RepID=A0A8H4VNH0_9AGAR|nr:hypothetical protein D9613_002450 [Agrocybe pediades]
MAKATNFIIVDANPFYLATGTLKPKLYISITSRNHLNEKSMFRPQYLITTLLVQALEVPTDPDYVSAGNSRDIDGSIAALTPTISPNLTASVLTNGTDKLLKPQLFWTR